MKFETLSVASAALTLVSVVNAGSYPVEVVRRTQEPSQPSCSSYTPFVYAGCFSDPSVPRALPFSGPSNQNMTVETCVAFCKGNDYQYAGLEYYNECFCGASVNGPQANESMCSYPCAGDATETCGGFDYISVYQDPTFPTENLSTISDYQPMGCYSEGSSGRSLVWRQNQLSTSNMTVSECLFACKDGGYSFAGVEYGQECYCGVVLGNGTLPLDSSKCNMPCTGNASETCGGSSTLNLYVAKDLESTQPCNGGSPGSSSSSSSIASTTTSSSSLSTPAAPTTTSSSSSISSTSSAAPSTTSTSSSSGSSPSPSSSSSSTSSPSKISTSTMSTSTTSKPLTTSAPTASTTKTTASLCTSITTIQPPAPTCEYQCGNWCSAPIPDFVDAPSCFAAFASCEIQSASCFFQAGFPASLDCFKFSSWCSSISQYCGDYCPGGSCSRESCKSKNPPSGPAMPSPTVSTSVYACSATSVAATKPTTTSPTTTTCVPIPTNTNICTQPSNPNKGYDTHAPVGGIGLPCLTCNNVQSEYSAGNIFKLYTDPNPSNCPGYQRSNNGKGDAQQGCKDACDHQYKSCINTYAEGCRNNRRGDNYYGARQKCQNQRDDCHSWNSGVSVSSGRCGSWNSGWF